jgi:hypothetical protein
MEKAEKKPKSQRNGSDTQAVTAYVSALSNEYKMLIALKAQLYGGNWKPMLDDLSNRLDGKPYIFKLVNRINEDVGRITEMKAFEDENGVDLAKCVDLS